MSEIPVNELCELIKVSQKCGVSKLKFGTLEVEFENFEEEPARPRPALKVSKKKIEAQTKQLALEQQFSDVKDELSTMHVEDPAGFEAAIVSRQIEDTVGGETFEETHNIGTESAL